MNPFFFAAIFILLLFILYYSLPARIQNGLLLAASYAFVIWWDWRFALIQLAVTGFHYVYGIRLARNRQKHLLVFGIAANVLLLLFFRSANFFVPELITRINSLGANVHLNSLEILTPIGLSYYTLQNISYLIDIYRKQIVPVSNFVNFALYLSYFPKLLAGPIERARPFISRLEQSKVFDNQELAKSIMLIVTGMVRKFVIADSLSAAIPADVFRSPAYFSPIDLTGWLIVYAFMIYHDFAGYTGIARGISGLFGIELSNNFDYPYFARNFSEFWNRWHITLSNWLRDYIFFPLNRMLLKSFPDRTNLVNIAVPPLVTMLASGLWHGLSWHMLLWGGLHGIYQILERLASRGKPVIPPDQRPLWRQLISNGLVFLLVALAWVPFRMELPTAIQYWVSMFNIDSLAGVSRRLLLILFYVGLWVIAEWKLYRTKNEYDWINLPRWKQASILAGALVLLIIAFARQAQPSFIYQGF